MIRFLTAQDLTAHPALRDSMFRDRADQFRTRLGWDVSVDAQGYEQDDYDACDPLYVICQGADGRHLGSMRFLPTTGPTMIQDHFSHLLNGRPLHDPGLWECTRFCLGREAGPQVAGQLMLAGGELLSAFGLRGFAGVFDARMVRIYRRIGAEPEVLGGEGAGRDRIDVGIWRFTPAARARVALRCGLSQAGVRHWFRCAFGDAPTNPFAPAFDLAG